MTGEIRTYIEGWLMDEYDYTVQKFGHKNDDQHTLNFAEGNHEWWDQQLDNYYHRAKVLGLDNPAGRQALAKFVATAMGMLESTVRVCGLLPEPGVNSGENLDNLRSITFGG